MVVGLFGFYSWMNFGDDLMAAMFAAEISRAGHSVVIYIEDGAGVPLSLRDYRVTNSLKEFVEVSDRVVVGGGGLLTPESGTNKKLFYDFRNLCLGLAQGCERLGKPIALFSIGGAGCGGNIGLHLGIASLLTCPRTELITLRLQGDHSLTENLNAKSRVYPDVVFAAARSLGAVDGSRREINKIHKVGLNLYQRKHERVLRAGLNMIPGLKVTEICTGGGGPGAGNFLGYDGDIHRFVAGLKEFDCLVTCKLHLGVVAMSLGIPTFLYFGAPKAGSCYREAGLENQIIGSRIGALKFLSKMGANRTSLIPKQEWKSKIDALATGGEGHLEGLSRWLAS
jgi:polysaccharide pyruvyl transferase WcaK-like protein